MDNKFLLLFFSEKFGFLFLCVNYEDILFDFIFFFGDDEVEKSNLNIIIKKFDVCKRDFKYILFFFGRVRLFRFNKNESYVKWEKKK